MDLGALFTIWSYGILTGVLALTISIANGGSSALRLFLAGGIGMTTGALFLFSFLFTASSIEQSIDSQRKALDNLLAEGRIARANRRRGKEEIARQARAKPIAFDKSTRPEENAVSRLINARAPIVAPRTVGTCWYCEQRHDRSIQCPYCRMLTY